MALPLLAGLSGIFSLANTFIGGIFAKKAIKKQASEARETIDLEYTRQSQLLEQTRQVQREQQQFELDKIDKNLQSVIQPFGSVNAGSTYFSGDSSQSNMIYYILGGIGLLFLFMFRKR